MIVLLPILVWIIFVFISVQSAKSSNERFKVAQPVQKKQTIQKPAAINELTEKKLARQNKLRETFAKPTTEKTHDHTDEVAETVLLEDRNNDWLARQIREEARVKNRPFN